MEKVSIIIPCKEVDDNTKKCINECLNLDYLDFEILVLPDEYEELKDKKLKNKRIRIIKTGKVKPAFKRNIAMKKARGKYFAFIDSDAYPRKDWLKNAIKYFKDEKIGLVGGPNLTPSEGNFAEKISGYVLANFLTSGPANIRYKISKNQYAKELPSCNYISRKEASSEYDSCFLTAEDSQFCFVCSKKGYKILYANDVVVYHHRRDTLRKHLQQLYVYGRDIAWLTKKEFSFDKLFYSLLSLFVIGFFIGLFIFLLNISINITGAVISNGLEIGFSFISYLFFIALFIYLIIMFLTSMHEDIKVSYFVFITSMETHFAYGIGWLVGIFSKSDKTEEVN